MLTLVLVVQQGKTTGKNNREKQQGKTRGKNKKGKETRVRKKRRKGEEIVELQSFPRNVESSFLDSHLFSGESSAPVTGTA